jgi:acyl carrier protein
MAWMRFPLKNDGVANLASPAGQRPQQRESPAWQSRPPRHHILNWTLTWCFRTRQITETAHFANDLGLDSLDTVEVVMAIEEVRSTHLRASIPRCELSGARPQCRRSGKKRDADGARIQEFSIEIPDKDADTIHSGTLTHSSDSVLAGVLTPLPTHS